MITTNKFIGKMIFLFVGALAFTACSPEDGKDGIDGQQGAQGEQGPTGNANIIASQWIDADFSNNTDYSYFYIDAPDITQEIIDSGVILAYGKEPFGAIVSIPFVFGKASYYFAVEPSGRIIFIGSSTDGSNISFTIIEQVRYVIIPASTGGATTKIMNRLYNGYTEEELKAMSYDELVNVFNISN